MGILKILFSLLLILFLSSCQMAYIINNGYHQLHLLSQRISIDKALENPNLSPDTKEKLLLTKEVKNFAEKELHLKASKNYTQFVQLSGPYVTYVVSAAPTWELENYTWSFPIIGKVPYKGYFNEDEAKKEAQSLKEQNYDVFLRGVSAFSTLGWFNDPLLSSMLRYSQHDLVNTIIHESVHATVYIKSSSDFNERLATFLGNKGTELFYLSKEGSQSKTLTLIRKENEDELLFSKFITRELKDLKDWYKNYQNKDKNSDKIRADRIKEIQNKFDLEVKKNLQTSRYQNFSQLKLNNAHLLVFNTYVSDLSEFEALFSEVKGDFPLFLERCKSLVKPTKL